jgi:hypothetical protein
MWGEWLHMSVLGRSLSGSEFGTICADSGQSADNLADLAQRNSRRSTTHAPRSVARPLHRDAEQRASSKFAKGLPNLRPNESSSRCQIVSGPTQ